MATGPSPAPARTPGSHRGSVQVAPKRSILTETSWSPRRSLTLSEWIRQGRTLGAVGRASGWWIGDWIRFGNARYGEKYDVAARISGYDAHSLMNMAYVASRFETSRRREKLSFSHHAEVAALPPEEQEQWLDRAELEGLSSRRIRAELRRGARSAPSTSPSSRGASTRADQAPLPSRFSRSRRPTTAEAQVVCPQCGNTFVPQPELRQPE
jgi:hypothetical protein